MKATIKYMKDSAYRACGWHECDSTNVVGVYISDDSRQRVIPVCQQHACHAELNGDGPVFYSREL